MKAKETVSTDQPDWVNEPTKPKAKETVSTDQPDWVNEPTKPLNWSKTPLFGNKDRTIESLATSPINLTSAVKDTLMLPVDIAKFAIGGMLDTARSVTGIKGGHATENAKERGSRIAKRLGNITKNVVKLAAAPAVTAISGFAAATTAISNRISNAYNAKAIKKNPDLKKTNNPSFELFKKSGANTAKAVGVAAIALTGGIALAPAAIAAVAPAVAAPAITALSAFMAPALSAAAGLASTASAAVSTGIAAVNGAVATGMGAVVGAPAATLSAITASTTTMAITGGAALVGTGLAVKYPKAALAAVSAPVVAVGAGVTAVVAGTIKAIDMAVSEPKRSTAKVVPIVEKTQEKNTNKVANKQQQQTAASTVTQPLTKEQNNANIRASLSGSSLTSTERRFQANIDKATQNSLKNQDNIGKEEQANIDKAVKDSIKTNTFDNAKRSKSNVVEQLKQTMRIQATVQQGTGVSGPTSATGKAPPSGKMKID